MDPGGLIRTVGGGVAGLVGGAIGAIGDGIGTIIRTGQHVLPGPLFPVAVGAVVVIVIWWLIKK
jgi:hypothetical protein